MYDALIQQKFKQAVNTRELNLIIKSWQQLHTQEDLESAKRLRKKFASCYFTNLAIRPGFLMYVNDFF